MSRPRYLREAKILAADHLSSDVAFSPTVKDIQTRKGSRRAYSGHAGDWPTTITPDLKAFIEVQISVFLGTASADGQPYIQHRGGPPGFLHVVDDTTIAFADFAGNRQYITQGNLAENAHAILFLMDFMQQQRVKIWGNAKIVEGDDALLTELMPENYRARGEQVLLFKVTAWNQNCSQHIPQRFEAADVARALADREARIAALEAEVERLKGLSD